MQRLLIGTLEAAIALPDPHMLRPSCRGLERIAPQLDVEPAMGKTERGAIVAEILQVDSHFGVWSWHARQVA